MATSGDLRDIMDLSHDGPRQSVPKKKKKQLETQLRLSGMSREVQALMGDSVPPVAIVETPKYKQKPSIAMKMFKPRHWEERQFMHAARKDGLQLRHWKRSIPGSNVRPTAPANNILTDTEMKDGDSDAPVITELRFEDEFPSEKWNVKVVVRQYNDEQYEKFFKSDDWTREETDYMMQLCQDYDLRWLLVADRYDPTDIRATKSENATTQPTYPPRRMEDLKQRYYGIASKMLELHTPVSNMTQSEFQLWEKMKNFDARTEVQRKAMAEKLFERTKEEADEEKVLLEELYRITKNEDDFIKMRKELYSRLETAPSLRRNERGEEPSTALYQTSQGLSMLLSSLLAKEKRFKTRTAPNGQEVGSSSQMPADAQKVRHANYNRRETVDSNAGDDNGPSSKKGSVSQPPVVRTLTPAEQVKYGVSHPQERLTSGVMFRHEKINRLTMAKSQVQTQKIGAALTELGIPPRLLMPTERVCREFERLVSEVQILLDTRRVLEKASSEVKVLEEHKRLRLGGGQDTDGNATQANGTDAMETDHKSSTAKQDKAKADAGSREGVQGGPSGPADKNQRENGDVSPAAENNNTASRDKETEVDDSQVQDGDDDDEDNGNDVDQSAMADDDEDGDDADQSFARRVDDDDDEEEEVDRDQEDDEEVNIDEEEDEDEEEDDDDDDDDAPGLEDLERANQVTDDEDEEDGEDEENEDEDGVDQLRIAEDEEDDDNEDGDGDEEVDEEDEEEDQAGVDESMLNGADDDDDEEEDQDGEEEEEKSRPHSSHSNVRAHKRSASVISEASRTESARSGAGRKKRR